jgi:hypothetical protein
MIIIAAAFVILFVVWVVRRTARRIRRAARARSETRTGALAETQAGPWVGSAQSAPEVHVVPPAPQEVPAEPPGPRLWGDDPAPGRRAVGGRGRP